MPAMRLPLAPIVIAAIAIGALLWIALAPPAGVTASQAEPGLAFASDDATAAWSAPTAAIAQGRDAQASADDDTRVPVQVWTVLAAGGAAGVGLVVYLLRVVMGWVKPPPPQKEPDH